MKFSKVLQQTATELPELNDMFLRYKELKKQLKSIPRQDTEAGHTEAAQQAYEHAGMQHLDLKNKHSLSQLSTEELKFIGTLNEDLGKFNRFFMEQEEEAVIQLQALTDELDAQQGGTPSIQLKERLVQFHGSCIMLMHWSLLNYAAVAKILKKHDKRTGLLLRAPCLTNVLQQPFNSTSVMSRLVKRAEEQLLKVSPPQSEGKRPSLPQTLQQHGQHHYQLISVPSKATIPSPAPQPSPAHQPHVALREGEKGAPRPQLFSPRRQQQQQQQDSRQVQQLQGAVEPPVQGGGSPVQGGGVVVGEEAAAKTAAATAATHTKGQAVAAEGAAAAGGGSMTHHALRALEMWRTLQATASTPSTVVPETSNQHGSGHSTSSTGVMQHQQHNASCGQTPEELRGEKRVREESE